MTDKKTIKQVSKIARLDIDEKEIDEFASDFSSILKSFEILKQVDTEKVKPSFQPFDIKNVVREDKAENCLSQEDALKNAEQKQDKFFKGPRAV